jgi:hypothetical protein
MLDTTTNQRGRQAAHQSIPNLRAPNAVTVTDGQTTTGTIAERDRWFFTFDAASVLICEYRNRGDAIRALPREPPCLGSFSWSTSYVGHRAGDRRTSGATPGASMGGER